LGVTWIRAPDWRVLQHPKRAIRALFHIADAVSNFPALGDLGAAITVKDDVTNPTEYDRDTFAIQRGTGTGCIKPAR
jgi:hypothetical protein